MAAAVCGSCSTVSNMNCLKRKAGKYSFATDEPICRGGIENRGVDTGGKGRETCQIRRGSVSWRPWEEKLKERLGMKGRWEESKDRV